MYALVRYVQIERGPDELGGLVAKFSGWMLAWVLTPYGIYTVVWLPLMVLFYDRAIRLWPSSQTRRQSYRWTIAAGIVIALQVLAGQIQFVSYNLIVLGLYGAIQVAWSAGRRQSALGQQPPIAQPPPAEEGNGSTRSWTDVVLPSSGWSGARGAVGATADSRLPTASVLAPIWLGGLAVLTGLLLSSIQLLPTLEILGLTGRAVRPFDQMLAHDLMPLPHLSTALVPYFFGSFLDDNYHGWLNALETTFYFGLAPLFLAVVALFRQRSPAGFFFALVGLLPLLVLLCPPVFSLFYLVIPGFKQTFPSRMLYLVPFGFAGLAALGAAALLADSRAGYRWPARAGLGLLLGWSGAAIVVLVGPLLGAIQPASLARFGWKPNLPYDAYQLGHLGWALGLLIILAVGTFVIGRRLIPVRYGACLLIGVFVLDSFPFGVNYNPAFPVDMLYPVTRALAFL